MTTRIKKYLVIFICSLSFLLTGCEVSTVVESSANYDIPSMFVVVEGNRGISRWIVVYHRDTKVMYMVSNGSNNGGDFNLLVNPDGTPMLWEGEQE